MNTSVGTTPQPVHADVFGDSTACRVDFSACPTWIDVVKTCLHGQRIHVSSKKQQSLGRRFVSQHLHCRPINAFPFKPNNQLITCPDALSNSASQQAA